MFEVEQVNWLRQLLLGDNLRGKTLLSVAVYSIVDIATARRTKETAAILYMYSVYCMYSLTFWCCYARSRKCNFLRAELSLKFIFLTPLHYF